MADQGVWFKLWCSADDDPDLDNLDVADFGRFCKLGLRVKSHGTDGVLTLKAPARTLCTKLQVPDFAALVLALQRLPHLDLSIENTTVTPVTIATVTFRNWQRYQGDNSRERVRRFRARVTPKKRREEMRGEENPPISPQGGRKATFSSDLTESFAGFWQAYPRKVAKPRALSAWRQLKPDAQLCERIRTGLAHHQSEWTRHGTTLDKIPHPATWIHDRRWEDERQTHLEPAGWEHLYDCADCGTAHPTRMCPKATSR